MTTEVRGRPKETFELPSLRHDEEFETLCLVFDSCSKLNDCDTCESAELCQKVWDRMAEMWDKPRKLPHVRDGLAAVIVALDEGRFVEAKGLTEECLRLIIPRKRHSVCHSTEIKGFA